MKIYNRFNLPPHIKRHSESMSWGYGGSGPSDLALSLLSDVIGIDNATYYSAYQTFKFDFVSKFNDDWKISEEEIREWYNNFKKELKI